MPGARPSPRSSASSPPPARPSSKAFATKRRALAASEADGLVPQVFAALDRLTARRRGGLGIAVSGGSDSTALAVLAAEWAGNRDMRCVTVDHRLRPESAGEAEKVAHLAGRLGLPHETLVWEDGPAARAGSGNLSAQARQARMRLMREWARQNGITSILLGHTMDDQAETVLMRLMRGSGADGLSGMAPAAQIDGMIWLRPLLGIRRETLRDYLRGRSITWVDDPSNDDASYDRVHVRHAIEALGLDPARLAESAAHLARQRRVLERDRDQLARAAVEIGACGEAVLDHAAFQEAEEDTRFAVLADVISWIGGNVYRPRFRSLTDLWREPDGRTLGGCLSLRRRDRLVICREPAAASARQPAGGAMIWDHRWQISLPNRGGLEVGPLGEEGLEVLRNNKNTADSAPRGWRTAPRAARATTPAIWSGNELFAAPIAGFLPERAISIGDDAVRLGPLPPRFDHCHRL
ncbi:tRNA lysidine(34) synthetase TilS [Rhodobacteraceae bacterium NNCM2]|nr:tRNA lysidine(34) synthetase TilS [Coraliihabitans acroporae]